MYSCAKVHQILTLHKSSTQIYFVSEPTVYCKSTEISEFSSKFGSYKQWRDQASSREQCFDIETWIQLNTFTVLNSYQLPSFVFLAMLILTHTVKTGSQYHWQDEDYYRTPEWWTWYKWKINQNNTGNKTSCENGGKLPSIHNSRPSRGPEAVYPWRQTFYMSPHIPHAHLKPTNIWKAMI